ncbi:MAG: nucleotidyl transferase AbiEii/AbiGii toxin family protein [Chloroflexota bacterium]
MLPENMAMLLAPLAALQRLLERFGERGVIMGGVATGLLGKPRMTVDIDAMFLLSVSDIPKLLQAANAEGIEPRIQQAGDFARKSRVLLLRHIASGTNIDISLGILPFEEEMVERSIVRQMGDLSIRLPTPEDLIILKAVAHRPKDLLDIQAVVASHPQLDRSRIEQWVNAFGEALELPELWNEIRPLLISMD